MMEIKRRMGAQLTRLLVPRLAYRHLFFEDETRHSMIHVQNPFSFFDPWQDHSAVAVVELCDRMGRRLGTETFKIPAYGSLAVDVRDLGISLDDRPFGTVSLDLVPPRDYVRYLRKIAPGVPRIASPFWVRFFDDRGSQAFVHSIEADRERFRGLPPLVGRLALRQIPGGPWESNRTIPLSEGSTATAFIVNHSRTVLESECTWWGVDSGVEARTTISVRPRGVETVSTPVGMTGRVYLSTTRLSTQNAKPYVLVENSNRLFALTHG